ncbi:MAG TPA: hypothetical protein VHC67_07215 [Gaiellaceae bacterium]|jgi:hypothetical protein|nr:hypothetical protein [Gaiellaceae bacterium]
MLLLNAEFRVLRLNNFWRDPAHELFGDNPEGQFDLFYALGGLWLIAYIVFALAWIGVSAVIVSVGVLGTSSDVAVFVFGSAFCITGAADALWRNILVWAARTRYRREDRTCSDQTRRLMRIAAVPDGTVLLQVGAGILFAWLSVR